MFILFVLRQWGQRLSRNWYIILGLGLVSIVEEELKTTAEIELNSDPIQAGEEVYERVLKDFIEILDTDVPSSNPI